MNKEKCINNLCNLLDLIDTEAMLALGIFYFAMMPQKHEMGLIKIEILAKYSIPRFGNNIGIKPNFEQIQLCDNLLEHCYKFYMFEGVDKLSSSIAQKMKMDSNIIRGSAYPHHKMEIIKGVQSKFDLWFKENVGIMPSRAIDIVLELTNYIENDINHKITELKSTYTNNPERFFIELDKYISQFLPVSLENLLKNEKHTLDEIKNLKKLIGVDKTTFNPTKEIKYTPLYILNSGKVLISDISNCMDIIFDVFDNKAKENKKFYDAEYQVHKSVWLEQEIFNRFEKIFPKENIYQNLSYTNGEADLIICYGDIVLLIEAKAKDFNADLSELNSINNVFRKNIEDNYRQSLRTEKYINSIDVAIFTEKNGRQLKLQKDKHLKFYHICVSLHHLAGFATELKEIQELNASKTFKENSYPFSICLTDLYLLTEADIKPFIFLHYIEKRLEILNTQPEIIKKGDELDLFGMYLDSRLIFPNKKIDLIYFASSQIFDELINYERGIIKDKPDLSLQIPHEIKQLLNLIEKTECSLAEKRIIIFEILNLNNDELYILAEAIKNLEFYTIPPNKFTSTSFKSNDTTFTITASNKENQFLMHEHSSNFQRFSLNKTENNKYRNKVSKSICFSFIQNDTNFLGILFIDFPWGKNLEIEKLINNEVLYLSDSKKLPKVNDKCLCGSGKKFKKCCINKVKISC